LVALAIFIGLPVRADLYSWIDANGEKRIPGYGESLLKKLLFIK
jgi:hypothetical protein